MIDEGNLLATVIDHHRRLDEIDQRHEQVDEEKARIEARRTQWTRLLWTTLGTVVAGLLLNLAEHFLKW